MRVLMLGWELPPNNSGGLGVACLQLSKALARSGADIDFVLPYKHEVQYDFMRVASATDRKADAWTAVKAYESHQFHSDKRVFSANDQVDDYSQKVGKLAESLEFDIIHAHEWPTFRAALLARQIKNRPLILHVHAVERDRAGGAPGNPIVREIEATSMLMADHVIAVSERTKQMIADDYHIPADKIEVVHNSIDVSALEPISGENAYKFLEDLRSRGWKVVVNVGRHTIQKGLTHLVRTAAIVVERRPKTLFLFVGDGEQRDELINLAAELGISRNVIFAGFQRGKNWRDAYASGNLFVMPSISEPFGLTPYEAVAYGCPSLISKQSGVSEVFRSSLKVDFWDTHEMANKICGVLDNDSLHDELFANARSEFEQLSWGTAADKIMNRYRSVREAVAI
ncbi:MAG TPA: glycosyltransferase family 4 protein [Candidatus Saccharimonadales bacterium]|nr:glycosyltransferase family 4 protein [Candidatus Saccharimonadales bacterium]